MISPNLRREIIIYGIVYLIGRSRSIDQAYDERICAAKGSVKRIMSPDTFAMTPGLRGANIGCSAIYDLERLETILRYAMQLVKYT